MRCSQSLGSIRMRNGVAWRATQRGMSLSWTRLNKHCGLLSGRKSREACFGAICFYALEKSYCWGRRGVVENLPISVAIPRCGMPDLRAARVALIKEGHTGGRETQQNDREIYDYAGISRGDGLGSWVRVAWLRRPRHSRK